MPVYRIVQKTHSVDVVDAYGRCVDTVLDEAWAGAPEPRPEATQAYLAELVAQGERSGRYDPTSFVTRRTYDSTTGAWSTQMWPSEDS